MVVALLTVGFWYWVSHEWLPSVGLTIPILGAYGWVAEEIRRETESVEYLVRAVYAFAWMLLSICVVYLMQTSGSQVIVVASVLFCFVCAVIHSVVHCVRIAEQETAPVGLGVVVGIPVIGTVAGVVVMLYASAMLFRKYGTSEA
jgi:hypothetical protein